MICRAIMKDNKIALWLDNSDTRYYFIIAYMLENMQNRFIQSII